MVVHVLVFTFRDLTTDLTKEYWKILQIHVFQSIIC